MGGRTATSAKLGHAKERIKDEGTEENGKTVNVSKMAALLVNAIAIDIINIITLRAALT